MVFRVTPSLGPDLEQHSTQFYFQRDADTPTHQLGVVVLGDDGKHYKYVRAGSSNIATDTQVTVAADGEATAGTGGWWTQTAIVADEYFWAVDTDPSP